MVRFPDSGLLVGIASPAVGALIDRYGERRVLLSSLPLFAGSLALLSFTPHSLAAFVALYALTGTTGTALGALGYAKVVVRNFDRHRGLALGVAMAGLGVGIALFPSFSQWMIDSFGWRNAYRGLALTVLLVSGFAILVFIGRESRVTRPIAAAQPPQDASAADTGLSVREAMLGRSKFWILAAALFLSSIVVNSALVHSVPLLTDRGYSAVAAATMFAAFGIATMLGRVCSGLLCDRVFAPYVAAGFFVLPVIGAGLLLANQAPLLALVLFGLATGSELDLMGYLTSRYLGTRRFGALFGCMITCYAFGAAAGPAAAGVLFDRFGSYDPVLAGFAAVASLSAVLILSLGPYRYSPSRAGKTAKAEVAPVDRSDRRQR